MTTINAPATQVTVLRLTPDVVQSCVLSSGGGIDPITPDQPIEQDPDIWVPVAAGVTYASLPSAPVITDTSPLDYIGCILDVNGNPQGRLNALFPDAANGDGVIERKTNDIWVFNGTTWSNVGPNPGPVITIGNLVPFFNEKVKLIARARSSLSINVLPYSLTLLTTLPIKTSTKNITNRITSIEQQSPVSITAVAELPTVIGGASSVRATVSVVNSTAAPVLGDSQVTPTTVATDAGWSLIFDSTADEDAIETDPFGFNFFLDGTPYTTCYVNANAYLTFGDTQNVYSSLSASNPAIPKIHCGSEDFSYQRVYTKQQAGLFRIRWEGNSSYSASAGNSNRFFEATFYQMQGNGTQFAEIRSGDIGGSVSGPFMIATATTALATGSFDINQSWVFTGTANGASWTIQSGKHIEVSGSTNVGIPGSQNIAMSAPVVTRE